MSPTKRKKERKLVGTKDQPASTGKAPPREEEKKTLGDLVDLDELAAAGGKKLSQKERKRLLKERSEGKDSIGGSCRRKVGRRYEDGS